MAKDDAGNCVTPVYEKPSCKVVPAPGETNIVKKIFAQAGLGKINELVYFQGFKGDETTYNWSKFIPDNSFSISPLVSDSLTTIVAQTSGLKMIRTLSGGIYSDMCWAIILGEPEPAAPTCSFEDVPLAEQIPGNLLGVDAYGGDGNYAWSVLTSGSVTPIDSNSASAVFNNPGLNRVQVSSNGKTGTCSIYLNETEEEEPVLPEEFPAVTCSPSSQSAQVGERVSFSATGGDNNYSWTSPAVAGSPNSSATAEFNSSGAKSVIVSSGGNSATCSVNVSRPAPTVNIWPSLSEVYFGFDEKIARYEISWSSSNADSCSASGAWSGGKATSGSESFTKSERGTYSYSITCSNSDNPPVFAQISVKVAEKPICLFAANPDNIVPPQTSDLEWECRYAQSCSIDNGIGSVSASGGAERVRPTKTATYNLDCTGLDGNSSNSATVTIDFIPWLKEIIPIW